MGGFLQNMGYILSNFEILIKKCIPGVMNLNSSNLCHICTDMFVKILAKPRQPEGKTHAQTDDDFSNKKNKANRQGRQLSFIYLLFNLINSLTL